MYVAVLVEGLEVLLSYEDAWTRGGAALSMKASRRGV